MQLRIAAAIDPPTTNSFVGEKQLALTVELTYDM
jgi:hypothetical protein